MSKKRKELINEYGEFGADKKTSVDLMKRLPESKIREIHGIIFSGKQETKGKNS